MHNFTQYVSEVKLNLAGKSNKMDAFFDEWYKMSDSHPFSAHDRIVNGNVTMYLYPSNGEVHLSDIRSLAPGSGAATKAMKQLMSLTKKHKLVLSGFAKAYSDDTKYVTDTAALIKWYKKLGFTVRNSGPDGAEIKYK